MTHQLHTTFSQKMGIAHPLVLAPMASVAGGELAAAVSAAGGLGLIGGGYGEGEFLERQFALAAGQSVGVGFISWSLQRRPDLLAQALSYRPCAVMLSFGALQPFAEKIKAANCVLIAQVQSLAQAQEAVAHGADVVVAQGTEAGGHGGARATLPLVPAVVDALGETPVLAAGGIADGRGLAAALVLGASGALMGSRFYASAESLAPAAAKAAAADASGDHTLRSSVFDALRGHDWPAPYTLRSLHNDNTDRWHQQPQELSRQLPQQQAVFQQAVARQDYTLAPVIVGEAVDLITHSPPAAQIVQQSIEQAVRQLRSAAALTER